MRTLNSAKNLASGISQALFGILLGFITRKVFVDNVGVEYLGLNGLLSNILGIMTLLEGGFASSVVYNLYKPIAEDDRPKILALLQIYRSVYRYIALGIFVFALILYPFIDVFIKDAENLEYISIVYFIFLFNSLIGYFTAYKWSIISASQKAYKLTTLNLANQFGISISKLLILYYTKNYILYLVVESLFGVLYNILLSHKANQLFPYIKTKEKYPLDSATRKNIITNMKALFINKIGGYFMHSTDNIVTSTFVGVYVIGLYSNYTLITGVINRLTSQILNSFSESVGNLIASESSDKIYEVFKTCFFLNFLVASIPVIILSNTLSPFISWWLGEQYLMRNATVAIILINYYINSMRSTSYTFKIKGGIFVQDRYTPLIQGIINLALSLLFVQFWGITGVLLATTISILSVGFWQFPRLCYLHIFHKSLKEYFKRYLTYTIVGAMAFVCSYFGCQLVELGNPLLQSISNGIISTITIVAIYTLAFHKTEQFGVLLNYISIVLPNRK